jgi:hypothetical protein
MNIKIESSYLTQRDDCTKVFTSVFSQWKGGDCEENDYVFAIFERGNGIPWSGSHLLGTSPLMIDSFFHCTPFLIKCLPSISSSVLFLLSALLMPFHSYDFNSN